LPPFYARLMHTINYAEEDRFTRWEEHRKHISNLIDGALIRGSGRENFSKKEIERIKQEIIYLTHIVISNYNKMLYDMCRETGKIAAISDILDLSMLPEHIRRNMDKDNLHSSVKQLLSSGYSVVGGYA